MLGGQLGDRHFDALVHATPLGMYPHAGGCYFEDRIPADVVFDLVYNPHETMLIRHAKQQGCDLIVMASHGRRGLGHRQVRVPGQELADHAD